MTGMGQPGKRLVTTTEQIFGNAYSFEINKSVKRMGCETLQTGYPVWSMVGISVL